MKKNSLYQAFIVSVAVFGAQIGGAAQKINTPAWESYYRFYSSVAEAREVYAQKIEPTIAKFGGKEGARPVIASSDERYARAEKAIEEVFAQFKKLFPERLSKFAVTPVVLVQDDEPNAYAVSAAAAGEQLIPYLFVINTALLDAGLGDDAIYGIVAHELAHLLLRHASSDQAENLQKTYRVQGSETNVLGFQQRNNLALAQDLKLWTAQAQDVGPISLPLTDLPLAVTAGFDLVRALDHLIENFSANDDCRKSLQMKHGLFRLTYIRDFDQFNMKFVISEKKNALGLTLASAGQDLRQEIKKCAANKKITLRELYSGFIGRDVAVMLELASDYQKKMFARDEEVFNSAKNGFEGLFSLVKMKRTDMRAVEKKYDLKTVRIYGSEEEADDASVQVMDMLGRDPAGIAKFFAGLLSDEQKKSCLETIKSGQSPSYGELTFPHHTHCYRIFHSKLVADYLKKSKETRPLSEIARATK